MDINDTAGVSVHAGFPNPAADANPGGLRLDRLLIAHPASTFFLRVAGSQGEEYGIWDGDIAVVDRALTPRPDDLTVWWQEDAFLVSRRKMLPGGTEAWGVVTSVIHRYRKP